MPIPPLSSSNPRKPGGAYGFDGMGQDETNCRCAGESLPRTWVVIALMTNARHLRGSAWLNFNRVLCGTMVAREHRADGRRGGNGALLGGLGHEKAWLSKARSRSAEYLHSEPTMADAFHRYEDERRTEVLRLQSAARNSTEWFEQIERYLHLDPVQFNYSLLTRSQRISHENLRERDRDWLASRPSGGSKSGDRPAPTVAATDVHAVPPARPAPEEPDRGLADGPYPAMDGMPTDWHLVHYAERAKGGAGLVISE